MMSNSTLVSRDLDKARRDLTEATDHLGHTYYRSDTAAIEELRFAIEATIRAVSSVALTVERLAELPACDGGHD